MNTSAFGVITKRLEEIGFSVHKMFKMPEKQALFEDLRRYTKCIKPYKTELTMVALDSDELIHCGSATKLDL